MKILKILTGYILAGVLLTFIQEPFGFSVLAWVAYLPMILAVDSDVKKRWYFLIGYICCLAYWLIKLKIVPGLPSQVAEDYMAIYL